jgi:predicted phage-related endonuclease
MEIQDPKFDSDIREYRELGDAIKRLKEQQNEVKERLVIRLAEAEKGVGTDFYCTYKSSTRRTIDTKKLQAELPEIYKSYSKETTSRTLRTNAIKKS